MHYIADADSDRKYRKHRGDDKDRKKEKKKKKDKKRKVTPFKEHSYCGSFL